MDTTVRKELMSFSVMTSHILRMFQPKELMEMVYGSEDYDWTVFKDNTVYCGEYWRGHPTIVTFWDVFSQFSLEQKRKFLLFLTGSDRVPLLGMKRVQMSIQPMADDSAYPVAHTCFNLLDLPKVTEENVMQNRLLECIEHTHGFSLV